MKILARLPTCPHCKKIVEKEQKSKSYKGRKYHVFCYSEAMGEKYEEKKEQQEPLSELYETIKLYHGIEEVTPMIKAQIEKYMTENQDWKYSSIAYAVWYYAVIEGVDIKSNKSIRGVGYLPYVFNKAKSYYIRVNRAKKDLEEQLENNELDSFTPKTRFKMKKVNYSLLKTIDIEDL